MIIAEMPIHIVVIALLVIAGVFVVVRALVMPASFRSNETKREELRRRRLAEQGAAGEDKGEGGAEGAGEDEKAKSA
ncbi:MAG: hypothetical protein GF418_02730 [Chitinivibrionales bacterium]|nr:hypothetical protein [Chitinivibrionales bacterium]MBD3394517.1 hypothetical protein [Chitinivibrionales bacterium]